MKKAFVVTGANNGIGLETSRALAAQGHKVLLVTRTEEKGQSAIRNIQQTHPDADLESYVADMSLLRDIRQAAAAIRNRHETIDGLINNVGTWMSNFELTPEGIETVFAGTYC